MKRLALAAASLVVGLVLASPAPAQPGSENAVTQQPAAAPEKPERPNATPPLVVAFVSTVLVLFVVCKPARKVPAG
jgi:hypothetical protein